MTIILIFEQLKNDQFKTKYYQDMPKSSIKPKVIDMWSEQTEKLKKKFASLMDSGLYFEQDKIDELLTRVQNKSGKPIGISMK